MWQCPCTLKNRRNYIGLTKTIWQSQRIQSHLCRLYQHPISRSVFKVSQIRLYTKNLLQPGILKLLQWLKSTYQYVQILSLNYSNMFQLQARSYRLRYFFPGMVYPEGKIMAFENKSYAKAIIQEEIVYLNKNIFI